MEQSPRVPLRLVQKWLLIVDLVIPILLYQPYNSDFDYGTGDFSIMFWVKSTMRRYNFWRNDTTGLVVDLDLQFMLWDIYISNSTTIRFRLDGAQQLLDLIMSMDRCLVCFVRSGSMEMLMLMEKKVLLLLIQAL